MSFWLNENKATSEPEMNAEQNNNAKMTNKFIISSMSSEVKKLEGSESKFKNIS